MTRIKSHEPEHRVPVASIPKGQYFQALDGYRGMLSVVVAIYHTIWLSNTNQLAFLNNGPVLIDLFFALSGFLMFTIYADKIASLPDAIGFMKRRFARLYPLHIATLLLALAYCGFRLFIQHIGLATNEPGEILPFQPGAVENVESLFSHLFLLHSMGLYSSLSFNVPSWTISVEFFTYIVFAAMMIFARPHRGVHFLWLTIACLIIYAALSRVKPNMNITSDLGFFRCLAGFFLGGVASFLYSQFLTRHGLLSKTWKTVLEVLTVFGATLFVIYCPGKLQFFVGPVILIFVTIFAFDGGAVSKLMSARPFRYLAKISYSIYMVHFVISLFFGMAVGNIVPRVFGPDWNLGGWGGDAFLVLYLLVVIGVAHLTQKYVEVPGGKFVSKLSFGISRLVRS